MRTKTLVLTAVLGAAGAVTMSAQPVYSVNAVGYVKVDLKAGFNLISNPLDNKGTGGNTVANILAGVPDGATVYKMVGGQYESPNAYFEVLGGWVNPNQTFAPGEGFFVLLPPETVGVKTITFVGDVMQGDLKNPLPAGFALTASQVPQAGKLVTDLKYPQADGDTIYKYTPTGYDVYSYFEILGMWSPSEPTVAVGEGFLSLKTAAKSWDRSFDINNPQ